MINITFSDKSIKSFQDYPSAIDVARSISQGFVKNCIAMEINGDIFDLNNKIKKDCKIKFITTKDDKGLKILRHSCAHVMAEAIQNLYKDSKLTIGPVVKDSFYYDIDMESVSEDDFSSIEAEMKKIIKGKKEFKRISVTKAQALKTFKNNPYKIELINELLDQELTLYKQGSFIDLCRGPHIPHTGMIKSFKLMKVSGAYWRADQSKKQLQRLYGTAFFDKKDLKKYINIIIEAKKRDHKKLGAKLDLYSFHENALGMPFFHAKGMEIWNSLLEYWRKEHKKAGYIETKTPVLLNKNLWEKSGHWENYRENMYTSIIDKEEYAIKPMNCPGGMLLYGLKSYSYRDFPLRAGEIGLVHRHEFSGALSGLFRVRAFHQDDAHIFMTLEQIEQEIIGVLKLMETMYSKFGLGFHIELSTRPEKSIGTDEQWEQATNGLKNALDKYGQKYFINKGDGAFYGPKIDLHIKDALERTWQCGTIQLDMALPERFDLTYKGKDNKKHRPIMIHRVVFGSIERFFGILVEHFAGKFPLWLAPVQTIILPINDDLVSYSKEIQSLFENQGIRCEVDIRTESLKKKIRNAQINYIPLIITIGEKEKNTSTLSVRTLDGKVRMGISLEEFLNPVLKHIKQRKLDKKIL